MTVQQFNALSPTERAEVREIVKLRKSGKVLRSAWWLMQLVHPGSNKFEDFLNANQLAKEASLNLPIS